MLKLKITNEEFDQLDEALQQYYDRDGDNYTLKVEGIGDTENDKEDVTGLKNKITELMDEAKQAKKSKSQLELEIEKIKNNKQKESGDFESLYKSSEQKRQELQDQLDAMQRQIADKELTNIARQVALKLGRNEDSAELLEVFLSKRLSYTDDGVKVTDDTGNLTVSTLDDLETEFKNNKKFAPLIKGSGATGGGAIGGSNGNNAKTYNDYSEAELVNIANTDPALYEQIRATK